jgi:hypothetical protein
MRDAIEDWEVLFQLQRAVELAEKSVKQKPEAEGKALQTLAKQAQALLAVPAEITADLTHWSEDPQVYLKHRHDAYELLAGLRSNLGAKDVDAYTVSWIADHDRWMQEKFEQRVKAKREEQ